MPGLQPTMSNGPPGRARGHGDGASRFVAARRLSRERVGTKDPNGGEERDWRRAAPERRWRRVLVVPR